MEARKWEKAVHFCFTNPPSKASTTCPSATSINCRVMFAKPENELRSKLQDEEQRKYMHNHTTDLVIFHNLEYNNCFLDISDFTSNEFT